MLERDLQRKIIIYLKEKKIYHFKTIISNKKGVPDIIGCYQGRFFGIECKSEKGKITNHQIREHEQIKENGGASIVVFANECYKQILSDFFNNEVLKK